MSITREFVCDQTRLAHHPNAAESVPKYLAQLTEGLLLPLHRLEKDYFEMDMFRCSYLNIT